MRCPLCLWLAGFVVVLPLGATWAQFDPDNPIVDPIPPAAVSVGLATVATDLVAPNHLTHAGDGTDRLFVVDQPGTIRLIKNGQLLAEPFLDVEIEEALAVDHRHPQLLFLSCVD